MSVPDDAHAPMGQIIKLRAYPAVDNHAAAAPNADTFEKSMHSRVNLN